MGPQDSDAFSLDLVALAETGGEYPSGSQYISKIPVVDPKELSTRAAQESTKVLVLPGLSCLHLYHNLSC